MSEEFNPAPVAPAQPKRWYRPRNLVIASLVVLGLGVAGAAVTRSVAEGYGEWHGSMMGGPGRHFGPGGFMGRRMDPAAIEDRVDRMVRHVAVEIDASNEQQDKLRTIAKAAVKDLVPMREKVAAARERAHGLMLQPNLSRADIEAFRTEQMALADTFSKRVAQALGDAAEVLTPEQRKKLDELIAARRERWHGWRRG